MVRFFIAFAMLSFFSAASADAPRISAPEAYERSEAGALTIIDVRRPYEWRATGLPSGATGATLEDRDFIDQVLAAVGGDKDAPVALSCRTGRRSERAAKILSDAGFSQVQNLREGFFGRRGSGPGWQARGLPVASFPAQ